MNAEERVQKAQELYEAKIRSQVEESNRGRYIAIDVNSGDYEIGDDRLILTKKVRSRHPQAEMSTLRIGFPTVGRIGTRVRPVTT